MLPSTIPNKSFTETFFCLCLAIYKIEACILIICVEGHLQTTKACGILRNGAKHYFNDIAKEERHPILLFDILLGYWIDLIISEVEYIPINRQQATKSRAWIPILCFICSQLPSSLTTPCHWSSRRCQLFSQQVPTSGC